MNSCSISYARMAKDYERVRGGDARADQLASALLPWLPDGLVCDVGAGTGVVTQRLAGPARTLIACDLSPEMLAQASPRLPGRVAVADAANLPLRDGSVDAVSCVWVLHNVGNLAGVLAEVLRVLHRGGRLLSISGISLPVPDDMAPIFERLSDELRPGRREQALAVGPLGVDMGFSIVHEGTARTTAALSPLDLVASMEQRHFAYLWDLPEDRWAASVEPALRELRSLPRPDEPRQRVFDHPFVVLATPGEKPAPVEQT